MTRQDAFDIRQTALTNLLVEKNIFSEDDLEEAIKKSHEDFKKKGAEQIKKMAVEGDKAEEELKEEKVEEKKDEENWDL